MNLGFPHAAASLSVLATLALLLLLLPPATSRAQTSGGGTLNGETLSRVTVGDDDAAFQISNLDCTQDGVAGFDFNTSGTASGPYPGTYTESGSVIFQNAPGGVILNFNSQFTITSGANVVTGTKQLAPDQPPLGINNRGVCQVLQNGALTVTSIIMIVAAEYTASVPTAAGPVTETGTSRVFGSWNQAASPGGGFSGNYSFNETYHNLAQITTLTLTPAAAVNPVATSHTVTATAGNASGVGIARARVYFDVTADGSPVASFQCVTNASGQCSFLYEGPEFPRADAITACVDRDDSGSIDPTDPCAAATKEWVLPASTPGSSNGGGQFIDASTDDDINFAFNFKSDAGRTKGSCHVNDRALGTTVKCLDVLAYVQGKGEATVYGTAEVNGVPGYYKIVLTDGAPGSDSFSIITQGGYAAGGEVAEGNVQIHTP